MKLKNTPFIIKNLSIYTYSIGKGLLRETLKPSRKFIIQLVDFFRSTLVPSHTEQIIQRVFDKGINNKNLCFFSHFDADGKVADYVFFYLEYLKKNFGVDIVFTTTCQSLDGNSLNRLETICRSVILRENYSLDFGSSKLAWEIYQTDLKRHYDKLIITNDSSYGPFFPFHDKVNKVYREDEVQLIGCTDSWENAYHIQSYFMLFNRLCHQSRTFIDFWDNFRYFRNKYHLIERCEVGLSQQLIEAGADIQPLFPYSDVLRKLSQDRELNNRLKLLDRTITVNPTHHFWDHLLKDDFPFVKIELLRDNPAGLSLNKLELGLKRSEYPNNLFLDHLKQTVRRTKDKFVPNKYSNFFPIDARSYLDQSEKSS